MANVRKSIAKTSKTLIASKAQADALAEKQKTEAQKLADEQKSLKKKIVKSSGSSAKKSLEKKEPKKTAPKKVSVKGKTTTKIKQDMKDQSTLYPLGGMTGEALIKHHQKRVQFLRENPDQNRSIRSRPRKHSNQMKNQAALRALHQERDKASFGTSQSSAANWNSRYNAIRMGNA